MRKTTAKSPKPPLHEYKITKTVYASDAAHAAILDRRKAPDEITRIVPEISKPEIGFETH